MQQHLRLGALLLFGIIVISVVAWSVRAASTPTAPPVTATCSPTGTSVTLAWPAASGATAYYARVQGSAVTAANCATNSGWALSTALSPSFCFNNNVGGATSITYNDITPGANYTTWVEAGNSSGVGYTSDSAKKNFSCAPHPAIGFNSFNYIFGYAQYMGYQTNSTYASNISPFSLTLIQNNLDFLSQHGVTAMRDIVPGVALQDTTIFYPAAAAVFRAYQRDNFTVLVGFGHPILGQDPTTSCMTATTDAAWQTAANNNATLWVNLLKYLKQQPGIDPTWLSTHVIIEPYNEFDGLSNLVNGACSGSYDFGTPKRAAVFQNAIATAFANNGITNEVVAPSIATGNFGPYLTAYYQAGGSGRPNIHTYLSPTTPADIVSKVQGFVDAAAAAAPAQYANKVILGEYGLVDGNWSLMSAANDSQMIQSMLTNADMNSKLSLSLLWDYMDPGPVGNSWSMPSVSTPSIAQLSSYGQAIVSAASALTSCPSGYTGTYPACLAPAAIPTPTSVTAACSANGTSVTLSWPAATGATSYWPRIQGSAITSSTCAANSPWFYTAGTPPLCQDNGSGNGITSTSVTFNGITPGASYTAWTEASNVSGIGYTSGNAKANFSCAAAAPTVTGSLSVTPATCTVASGSTTCAESVSYTGANQTQTIVDLYQGSTAIKRWSSIPVSISGETGDILTTSNNGSFSTNLTPGSYTFKLSGYDGASWTTLGTKTVVISPAAVSQTPTPAAPATPTGLASSCMKGGNVSLAWQASPGATYYGVALSPVGGACAAGWTLLNGWCAKVTTTSTVTAPITTGTAYSWEVISGNSVGWAPAYSSPGTFTCL